MLPSDHGGDIAFHTTCPSASSSLLGAMLKSSGESEESRGEPSGGSAAKSRTRVAGRGIVYPVASWERYEFLGLLGHGGMGSVYRARDCRSQRIVALKFIGSAEARYQERFVAEARILRRLSHPGICKVFEAGEVEGKAFIAMQYIEGQPLDKAQARMTLREKVAVIRETALALHAAHQAGIIHRDVKPGNVMVESGPEGGFRPILMDFGLARDTRGEPSPSESGLVMGTPWYMSPEQLRGESRKLDRRTDVYSLGASLFEILVGRPPECMEHVSGCLSNDCSLATASLSDATPALPAALGLIIGKCLAAEPAQRFQSAQALAEDLERFLGDRPIKAAHPSAFEPLGFFLRQHLALVLVSLPLVLCLVAALAYGVGSVLESSRRARLESAQAALAQRLAPSLEQLDGLLRLARAMPMHDISHELGIARNRLVEIEDELRSHGELAQGLAHYARGRGHLALHEWTLAHDSLRRAQQSGLASPELDLALGRALGELYQEGLAAARRSGDADFFVAQQRELEARYLAPALHHLDRGRGLDTGSASYVEGLIEYHLRHHEEALLQARRAQRQTPWLPDSLKLQGDVYAAMALEAQEQGRHEPAARSYELARSYYEQASELARSDAQLRTAIAEVGIRELELDGLRGRDARLRLPGVLAAAERATRVEPAAASGAGKQTEAYLIVVSQLDAAGQDAGLPSYLDALIESAQRTLALHPREAFARTALSRAYRYVARLHIRTNKAYKGDLDMAKSQIHAVATEHPRFPWAYNDLGRIYLIEGDERLARHQDPMTAYYLAIDAFERAIRIDTGYLNGYGNIALTYASMAQYAIEIGQDPASYVDMAIESAQKAIELNGRFDMAYGAIIYALLTEAQYNADSGRDVIEPATKAQRLIEKLAKLQPNVAQLYQRLAYAHYLIARQKVRNGADPDAAIENSRQALATCQSLGGDGDGACSALEALLLTLCAARQQQLGRSPKTMLEQAQLHARLARERGASEPEILLSIGEVSYHVASLRLAANLDAAREIMEGLDIVHSLLRCSPGRPRAHALQGALYELKARLYKDGLHREEALALAEAARARAEAGNHLLKGAYRSDQKPARIS